MLWPVSLERFPLCLESGSSVRMLKGKQYFRVGLCVKIWLISTSRPRLHQTFLFCILPCKQCFMFAHKIVLLVMGSKCKHVFGRMPPKKDVSGKMFVTACFTKILSLDP